MDAIVSVDLNYGIGCGNELLLKIPEDLKNFKNLTLNNFVVMGSKTYESLPTYPNGLSKRFNIVITSNSSKYIANCNDKHVYFYDNIDLVLKNVRYTSLLYKLKVFIIGGASIYSQFLPYCDKIHLTKIYKAFPSDKKLENIELSNNWILDSSSEINTSIIGVDYNFLTFKRTVRGV